MKLNIRLSTVKHIIKPTIDRQTRNKQYSYKTRAPTNSSNKQLKNQLIDYDHYDLNKKELAKSIMMWSAVLFFVSYSFYQLIWLSVLLIPLSLLMLSYDRKRLINKRKQRMKLQLKDILMSLVSSLTVGRSIETSFAVASDDMALLYPHSNFEMIAELNIINHRIRNGESIEQSLQQLVRRANIEELTQFVEALQTCKRSGGDLLAVMRRTAAMLSDQISVDNEIQVLLAQKKLEGRLMMAAPFAFLQFFHTASPSYMETLRTPLGYILLTIILLLLLLLFWVIDRLMTIRL